jgi:hypothetical protein
VSLIPADAGSAIDAASDPIGFVIACCDQARMALADAQSITEGRNVLGALSTLEHAVKVRDLNAEAVVAASAMRVRAERRVGELIREERDAGRLSAHGGDRKRHLRPINVGQPDVDHEPAATLADHGISRDQAAEFARLAEADEDTFEDVVESIAEEATTSGGTGVTRAAVLRKLQPEQSKRPDERWIDGDRFVDTCRRLANQADAAESAITFGTYPGDDHIAGTIAAALDQAQAALSNVRRAWDRSTR